MIAFGLWRKSLTIAGATCTILLVTPALPQKSQPFGPEKVETRPFRNPEVEKARTQRQPGSAHQNAHGTRGRQKGHHGHRH